MKGELGFLLPGQFGDLRWLDRQITKSSGQWDDETREAMHHAVVTHWLDDSRSADSSAWLRLFRAVGFLDPNGITTRATWTPTLYRGATSEHRAGLGWTSSPSWALYYATEHGAADGRVWCTSVAPADLLAVVGHVERFGYVEYVVDPTALYVWEYDGPPIKPL